jgi:hypothetical protein
LWQKKWTWQAEFEIIYPNAPLPLFERFPCVFCRKISRQRLDTLQTTQPAKCDGGGVFGWSGR